MNLKYAAFINIVGIVFSSFTPVLASTQSDKLVERERRLTERAVNLSGKEINLEDTEKQLNRKRAELDELEKKMHSEKVEFSVREIELDDMRAKLNYNSELLAAQNRDFLNDKAEFEGYRASVIKLSEDAEEIMRVANQQLRTVKIRENETLNRARELKAQEDKLVHERKEIDDLRADLSIRGKKLDERDGGLDMREERLKIAQNKLNEDKKQVETDWALAKSERKEAEKKRIDAARMMEEADAKIKVADAIIEENNALTAKIYELSFDIIDKEKTIAQLKQQINDIDNIVKVASVIDGGTIDWSKGIVSAKGLGVVPPNKTKAQGEALARRAAIADLQRNLLETVQGVQIDAKTTVEDHMAKDIIKTAVVGTIRGVEITNEEFDEEKGKYTIEGHIQQAKLANVMSKILADMTIPNRPKEATTKTGGSFTGLIIDARNLAGLQERKAMRIVDEKGIPVYGVEFADRNLQARIGLCEYYKDIVRRENEARVGNNPLFIEAQRLSNSNEDIVIPTEAAEKIRNNRIDFRKDCKVIVVRS